MNNELNPDQKSFLNTIEASEYLQLTPPYLSQLRTYRTGPAFIRRKRRVFYPTEALKANAKTHGIEVNEFVLDYLAR
jgi:hypothetical protein